MNEDCDFYICSTCFSTSETSKTCHGQMMVHCGTYQPGDIHLKPFVDEDGDLKSEAPRWFLQQAKLQKGFK